MAPIVYRVSHGHRTLQVRRCADPLTVTATRGENSAGTRQGAVHTRRVGRPARVGREEIVEAALAVIERCGVRGLTMQTLSEECGGSKTSAYHYVATKAELLGLAAMTVADRCVLPPLGGSNWADQLTEVALARRTAFRRYPGLPSYVSRHDSASSRHFVMWFRDLLSQAGFDDRTIVGALAVFRALVIADLDEPQSIEPLPEAKSSQPGFGDIKDDGFWSVFYMSVDLSDGFESFFRHGLEQLIEGLRRQLEVRMIMEQKQRRPAKSSRTK